MGLGMEMTRLPLSQEASQEPREKQTEVCVSFLSKVSLPLLTLTREMCEPPKVLSACS